MKGWDYQNDICGPFGIYGPQNPQDLLATGLSQHVCLQVCQGTGTAMSVDLGLEWINHLSVDKVEFTAALLMSLWSFCGCVNTCLCPSKQSLHGALLCVFLCVHMLCTRTSSGCIVSVRVTALYMSTSGCCVARNDGVWRFTVSFCDSCVVISEVTTSCRMLLLPLLRPMCVTGRL